MWMWSIPLAVIVVLFLIGLGKWHEERLWDKWDRREEGYGHPPPRRRVPLAVWIWAIVAIAVVIGLMRGGHVGQ